MAKTIAIVDDDASFVELTRRYLVFHGFSVWSAEDPASFAARALDEPPDAVLLDMQMRGGGGPQVIAALRNCPELKDVRVVVCSGMPVDQQVPWAEGLTHVRFLGKPFDTRALKTLLEELLPAAAFLALTREVSPAIGRCELTHLARAPIDVERARAQHAGYEKALRAAGCDVRRLPADESMPDAVFIEDTAVVLDELVIVARPGAGSRRGETAEVERALEGLRPLARISAPGTLDGGDVLVAGRRIFAGLTGRTNADGIRQLAAHLSPHGYAVAPVPVEGCLHLKSAATAFKDDGLLVNLSWVDKAAFPGLDLLPVDPAEPYAANVLRIGETVLMPSIFPRTRERLEREWVRPVVVEADELAKAEGAVTCCSLILKW